jgi:hypothetical protein
VNTLTLNTLKRVIQSSRPLRLVIFDGVAVAVTPPHRFLKSRTCHGMIRHECDGLLDAGVVLVDIPSGNSIFDSDPHTAGV